MTRNYVGIYAVAVCFIAAVVLSVTLAKSIYNVLEISAPEITMRGHVYDRFQSNERFLRSWPEGRPVPDAAEAKRLREEGYRIAVASEKRSGIQGLINSLISLVVTGILFFIHWRLVRRR